ncbi:MAG: tRNA (adenosine(37)-N6)-dimethylallyltransferase MiaA [Bacteroidetes bacterium MedPE-SWsnd-G2]|nr:MAG: tRNA (adenosine(37)-N6)-dimethylallyltransferase MiaA [Bacteroidetes bacterium MedPE-SWsnd-G2]
METLNTQKYLISVVGPTAIGKTALSIKLANYFNTEIISADSRQFFKEMQIGTAAPSKEELEAAPHHFIHNKSVTEDYSVGQFEKEGITCITTLHKKHDVVILVGGSGLYVDAITKGLDYFPEVSPEIRSELNQRLKDEGLLALQNQLQKLDLKSYSTIAIDNPKRVIRALEICIASGQPYSSFLRQHNNKRPFKTITIGLTAEREIIYDRINRRVDIMMDSGLLDEVKSLLPHQHLNALNTVGYKEIFKYLNNDWTLDFAISEIKKNSRRFAKRQLTWFRKSPNTLWFDYQDNPKDIIKVIETHMN